MVRVRNKRRGRITHAGPVVGEEEELFMWGPAVGEEEELFMWGPAVGEEEEYLVRPRNKREEE